MVFLSIVSLGAVSTSATLTIVVKHQSSDSPLAIKANCVLTLFKANFANGLGAQTLLVGM